MPNEKQETVKQQSINLKVDHKKGILEFSGKGGDVLFFTLLFFLFAAIVVIVKFAITIKKLKAEISRIPNGGVYAELKAIKEKIAVTDNRITGNFKTIYGKFDKFFEFLLNYKIENNKTVKKRGNK